MTPEFNSHRRIKKNKWSYQGYKSRLSSSFEVDKPIIRTMSANLGGRKGDTQNELPPQTLAIEVEPSEAMTSEFTRTV